MRSASTAYIACTPSLPPTHHIITRRATKQRDRTRPASPERLRLPGRPPRPRASSRLARGSGHRTQARAYSRGNLTRPTLQTGSLWKGLSMKNAAARGRPHLVRRCRTRGTRMLGRRQSAQQGTRTCCRRLSHIHRTSPGASCPRGTLLGMTRTEAAPGRRSLAGMVCDRRRESRSGSSSRR